jgi:pyruvate,orthophosphate dikinase
MGKSKMNVYTFSKEGSDGDASMKSLLGGKGANLAEMCKIGLSVPPGFTISTEVCETTHSQIPRILPAALCIHLVRCTPELESCDKHRKGGLNV